MTLVKRQAEAPEMEYVPASQLVQEVAAGCPLYFPAPQSVQVSAEVAPTRPLYFPASQFLHLPPFSYFPAEQYQHE